MEGICALLQWVSPTACSVQYPAVQKASTDGSGGGYGEVFSGLVLDNFFLVLGPSSYVDKMGWMGWVFF